MTTLLLSRGARVDLRYEHGNTPLHSAVFYSCGRGEAIRALLAGGADRDATHNCEVSPYTLACTIANYDLKQFFE